MPNYVYHKIIFDADKLAEVLPKVLDNENYVDFSILVPQPSNVYQGNLGKEEEEDFKLNWYNWNVTNWGSKWNANLHDNGTYGVKEVDGKLQAWIQFETAWSVVYPWIAAFINATQVYFELYYLDEGDNFWGYEKYGKAPFSGGVSRTMKRRNDKNDYDAICLMFGRNLTEDDEE